MLILTLLSAATPALPSAVSPHHVATRYERWERRLRSRVEANHRLPDGADPYRRADVSVRFSVGADGRPSDIAIKQSSGFAIYDSAAMDVVRKLGRIGPVPTTAGDRRPVVVELSYGEERSTAADRRIDARLARNRRTAHDRNVWSVTARSSAVAVTQAFDSSLQP